MQRGEAIPACLSPVISAKLTSVQEVLRFSGPDLQRLTALSSPDVQHLLKAASLRLRGSKVLTGGPSQLRGRRVPLPRPCAVWTPHPALGAAVHLHSGGGWWPQAALAPWLRSWAKAQGHRL